MAFFSVTARNGNKSLINGNMVNKVIDYGSYRTIYQGSDNNYYDVRETLASIQNELKK